MSRFPILVAMSLAVTQPLFAQGMEDGMTCDTFMQMNADDQASAMEDAMASGDAMDDGAMADDAMASEDAMTSAMEACEGNPDMTLMDVMHSME